ncbi:MAG: hypothetical protein OXF93_16410 [Acidobacteria bacterium]|nr:hypothetical protein [Acidobacteriota bacterium]
MNGRRFAIVVALFALVSLAAAPADAQEDWAVPRTADGQPDLQGIWTNNSATPMERPEQLGEKARLTDEELADLTARIAEFRDAEQAGDLLGDRLIQQALGNAEFQDFDVVTGNYNAFWLVERELDSRTSLIIDPPNGRRPAMTAEAQERASARGAYLRDHPSDGPENRTLGDRCLHFGAPNMGSGYNSYLQILQTPGHVAIYQEMGHEIRTIPLDAGPHAGIPQWNGDARGRWEGDTLVIETRDYSPQARFSGASENLHLVERFTRVSPDVLRHEITLNDPETWTQPWTVELLHTSTMEPIFEYACHEGNYAMPGILGGARREESEAEAENQQ